MLGGDVPGARAVGGGGRGGGVGGMSAAALADPTLLEDMAPERLRALDGPGVEALVRRLARAGVTGVDLDFRLGDIKKETKATLKRMHDVYKAERRAMSRARPAVGAGLELDQMFEPPEGEDRAEILRNIRAAMVTKASGPDDEETIPPLVGNVEIALRMGCGLIYPDFLLNLLTSKPETADGSPVEDTVCNQVHSRLTLDFSAAFAKDAVFTQIDVQAARRQYHPVRDYLLGLVWDGTPRLDDWAPRLLGAENTPYHRAVGAYTLCGAVQRALYPGSQHDHMTIFEGYQGMRKSTAVKMLSPNERWFLDKGFNVHDLDKTSEAIQGAWIVEVGELKGMKMVDAETLKQWLTQTKDHFRPSYGHHSKDYWRQCIFIGTTNRNRYLVDETGGRRFLPVECRAIDINALVMERDQLWAEAVARMTAPGVTSAWSLFQDIEKMGKAVQESRRQEDVWADDIRTFLDGKVRVHTCEIRKHLGFADAKELPHNVDGRIAAVVRTLPGWGESKDVKIDGVNRKGYAFGGLPYDSGSIPEAPGGSVG